MKVMFDTSVLVPSLLATHPHHPRSAEVLNRALNREFEWFVAAHSLAECYATLTAKTKTSNLQPSAVAKSIQDHFVTPKKIGAERLYTFNIKHFLQVWPEVNKVITAP